MEEENKNLFEPISISDDLYLKKQLHEGENFKLKNQQDEWTKENILAGLERFYKEEHRYPTALEIDSCKYLPSSRQIQRKFGGLIKLRQDLGFKIVNYGVGDNRSIVAKEINKRGRNLECEMEKVLVHHFGEYFVHVEKPLLNYYIQGTNIEFKNKARADFFIYALGQVFCVDVFYASNMHNYANIINIKKPKYQNLDIDVYLVNMNEDEQMNPERIQNYVDNMVGKLDGNVHLISKYNFLEFIKRIKPLHIK